jgi:hypothetical protein
MQVWVKWGWATGVLSLGNFLGVENFGFLGGTFAGVFILAFEKNGGHHILLPDFLKNSLDFSIGWVLVCSQYFFKDA